MRYRLQPAGSSGPSAHKCSGVRLAQYVLASYITRVISASFWLCCVLLSPRKKVRYPRLATVVSSWLYSAASESPIASIPPVPEPLPALGFRLDLATYRRYNPRTSRQAVSDARVGTDHPF